MSLLDNMLATVGLKRKSQQTIEPEVPEDTSDELEPQVDIVNNPHQRVRVTGYNVVYIVPEDMKRIKVRLLKPNGAFKAEYTLTNYLSIKPGERVQLKIET